MLTGRGPYSATLVHELNACQEISLVSCQAVHAGYLCCTGQLLQQNPSKTS